MVDEGAKAKYTLLANNHVVIPSLVSAHLELIIFFSTSSSGKRVVSFMNYQPDLVSYWVTMLSRELGSSGAGEVYRIPRITRRLI